jgi:hypothetical protein
MPNEAPPNETQLLIQALRFPTKRLWWWASLAVLIAVFVGLSVGLEKFPSDWSNRRWVNYLRWMALAAIARFYIVAIHSILTGSGTESWQGDAYGAENMQETLNETLVTVGISFLPLILWYLIGVFYPLPVQPWTSLFAVCGCHYFCMAIVGVSIFGGVHGVSPEYVFPALWRCS